MKLSANKILDIQKNLLECLSSSGSLQDLLEIVHQEFKRPMFIKGDGSIIYAISKGYSSTVHPNWTAFEKSLENHTADFESVRSVSVDPEFSRAFTRREPSVLRSPFYGGMVLHTNIWFQNHRILEVVVLENKKPFIQSDMELMQIFAQYVELHVSLNKERYITGSDLSATFTALLDNKSVAPFEFINMNNSTGWSADDELAVLLTDTSAKNDTPLLAVFRDKIKNVFSESYTFVYKNHVVSIINITKSGGYRSVSKTIGKMISGEALRCGLSYEYTGAERTLEFYNQATLACIIADKQDKKFLDMYGAANTRITERMHSVSDLQAFIHPDLLRLDSLDPQRTSHYLETLYAYLLCGGNYTDTANYLGLHRNSLIYRMNRIQSIIKSDLNDVQNKHLMLISYLLMGISF